MFKRFFKKGRGGRKERPRVIKRQSHAVSCNDISENALKVLYRLNKAGYEAYLVGGGVRDMLLHTKPKDFDVATNARPQEVRQLFRNSRLIGKRFRLVHVFFPNEIIEVSTFRANAEEMLRNRELTETKGQHPGILLEDNTYGTIEEDAWRRDFTVNALYYNIKDLSVVDFTGGMADLQRRMIRMIGDPVQRYHEDPIRLLRAIRLSAKLGFKIEPKTRGPLAQLHGLLRHVPSSRLFYEMTKLFFEGHAYVGYQQMMKMGYMNVLFPETMRVATSSEKSNYLRLIELVLQATDRRYHQGQTLNPGFLFGVFLWPVVQDHLQKQNKQRERLFQALHHGISIAIQSQSKTLPIPRRLIAMMRSMWTFQYHLERRRASRIHHIFHQRFFRAAFDFLKLRAESGEPLAEIVQWWQTFQDAANQQRDRLIDALKQEKQ